MISYIVVAVFGKYDMPNYTHVPTRIKEDIVASLCSEDKVGCVKCKFPSLASLWECDSWRCSSIQAYHLCAISIIYSDVTRPCGPEELREVNIAE